MGLLTSFISHVCGLPYYPPNSCCVSSGSSHTFSLSSSHSRIPVVWEVRKHLLRIPSASFQFGHLYSLYSHPSLSLLFIKEVCNLFQSIIPVDQDPDLVLRSCFSTCPDVWVFSLLIFPLLGFVHLFQLYMNSLSSCTLEKKDWLHSWTLPFSKQSLWI